MQKNEHDLTRPLSTLLSQVLVAFTIELDDEFEKRMAQAGDPGARLSLVVWLNLMRFVPDEGISVSELAGRALAAPAHLRHKLGCLERWRFVVMEPGAQDKQPVRLVTHPRTGCKVRDGWGSGRGIRPEWNVRLTGRGVRAREIWPPLVAEIEKRWRKRFGAALIDRLRTMLEELLREVGLELPEGLPGDEEMALKDAASAARESIELSLPALLSQVLLVFALEFNQRSRAPISLCANTLRVLGEKPVPVSEIPRLTGASPETSGLGWQHKPYVVVQSDPTRRSSKLARLTDRGLSAVENYQKYVGQIEAEWETRFGRELVRRLRKTLTELLMMPGRNGPLLAEGLVPPKGVARAGEQVPALGRRTIGPAARQRMRDLAVQTEAFVRDPAGTLPHYPLWDMNRGFGP